MSQSWIVTAYTYLLLTLPLQTQAGPIPLTPPPTPQGKLPLSSSSAKFLGTVHSATTYVQRDLGFQGKLGNSIILTYGDTLYSDAMNSTTWRGMSSDSAALATTDPLVVWDTGLNSDGYPRQFVPIMTEWGEDAAIDAMGNTNVVDLDNGNGIIYFLKNHRPYGINHIIGAGVANVSLTYPQSATTPVPVANRISEFWWNADFDPWYGDICAMRDENYVYAYGHSKSNDLVYISRVPIQGAFDLSKYEYWNGDEWQDEKLTNYGRKEAIFGQVNQGQVFFSKYWGSYVFVYMDTSASSKILAKTSSLPQGPWSDPFELYQAQPVIEGGMAYAAIPHPYYDETGKTLVITYTETENTIQAIKVVGVSSALIS